MDPVAIIKDYHQQTKHHFYRYADSLGYMDWNSQPDPFRRFAGCELILLPFKKDDISPPYDDLFCSTGKYKTFLAAKNSFPVQQGRDFERSEEFSCPRRVLARPLTFDTLSQFFEYSLTVSAWKQYGLAKWALRVNPSSGNLHPTEGYCVLPALKGLSPLPGVYHYAPKEHGLEQRVAFPKEVFKTVPDGIFFVALTSIYWRESWKYGVRGFRYCQHDGGHAYMAVYLAARMLGWRCDMMSSCADNDIARILGLDRTADFTKEELEAPEMILAIDTNPVDQSRITSLPGGFVEGIAAGTWKGKANSLSRSHHDWALIEDAHEASLKPQTDCQPNFDFKPADVPQSRSVYTSHQIIKRRRSAVDLDGTTYISSEQFYRILSRVACPMPGIPWSPKIHLCLFVHRVEGLKTGLYFLVRNMDTLGGLKGSTRSEFLWQAPPDCPSHLNLFCLQEGDFINIAKTVSCHQHIAGDGAFSLGMISEFDKSLGEYGAWFYKRLFWETGMIGQIFYLEAENMDIAGTGIGCFFDDPVHEILGLKDARFQSLYHFTVGGAVVDDRLTTLPAHERVS